MHTFVPDRTCCSLLLTALEIRLRNKPTYNKLQVLIINKDVRKLLARKNGNENPIWSWNDSTATERLRVILLYYKQKKTDLHKVMGNQCKYLTMTQRKELLKLLQKFEELFDGKLGTWKTDPLYLE